MRRSGRIGPIAAVLLLLAVFFAWGCGGSGSSRPAPVRYRNNAAATDQILDWVANILSDLNDAGAGAVGHVTGRLNEWLAEQPDDPTWAPDPLIETLPEPLAQLADAGQLAQLRCGPRDDVELKQIVWLRDLANVVTAEDIDDLVRARSLFDWVVRNIQLQADDESSEDEPSESQLSALPRLPWHTMLLGRGRAVDRGWLFALLARQVGLDVVMLAATSDDTAASKVRLAGVHLDGNLFLFDPALGLPIPGPDGEGVATLAQVASDDNLLRQLDLPDEPYPATSEDFANVVAFIEASPVYLSRRMELIESEWAGTKRFVLTVDASALAASLGAVEHVADARLWPLPYERLRQESRYTRSSPRDLRIALEPFGGEQGPLMQGRLLHLAGRYAADSGDEDDREQRNANLLYLRVRPPESELRALESDETLDPTKREYVVQLLRRTKANATYWLGLVAFERENYTTAIDFLKIRTLKENPKGPWTAGARYNLGRTYEAMGEFEEAIAAYESDDSPQRHGSRLRAARLRRVVEASTKNE